MAKAAGHVLEDYEQRTFCKNLGGWEMGGGGAGGQENGKTGSINIRRESLNYAVLCFD